MELPLSKVTKTENVASEAGFADGYEHHMHRTVEEEHPSVHILPHMRRFIWNGNAGTIVRRPAFSADIPKA